MLSQEEIKTLIVSRILITEGDSYHSTHIMGQIRALVSVLIGEAAPITEETTLFLDLAQIPYHSQNNEILFDGDWMSKHGFEESHGRIVHPRFTTYW